ncbi:MAG TPA: hypothetical protein VIC30_12625 [Orrella sp.]
MPLAFIKPLFAVPCILTLLAGCTTPASDTIELPKQAVAVETFAGTQPIVGLSCELSNDRGQWTVVTPGTAQVIPSSEDLSITCANEGEQGDGLARAVSMASAGYLANPAVNLAMPAVAVTEQVRQFTVGITRVYPARIEIMMGQDIIVTATQ